MSGRKYPKVSDGEWVQPVRKGYRMRCCDCGLVHVLDFRLVKRAGGRKIQLRASRDNRATAAIRARGRAELDGGVSVADCPTIYDPSIDDIRPVTQHDVDAYCALMKAWGRLRTGESMDAVYPCFREDMERIFR